MDFKKLIDEAISLAKTAGSILPGVGSGAAIAEDILNVVDGLKAHATSTDDVEDLEAAHKELYDAMVDKGHTLSDRLRG